jgi:transposase
MESTGVYWVPLFLLLQEYGFEVYLVNAKHVKNVTGRKDDESDAEWIQKLHSCGLLEASFQPDNLTRTLRSMVRHRKSLVSTSSTYLNRMQKALELMNIKLHTVISDIDGKTGLLIIEAILAGERNPEVLADLRDKRIKASREEIIKSLEGHWSGEHLFELRQCYQLYCTHREMIDECDKEIEKQLIEQVASKNGGVIAEIPKVKRKVSGKHKVPFNLTSYLKEILGVDVTEVFGISELSALAILAEVGADMSKWKNEHHFTSWLGLAPNTKISGGKVISSRIKKKKHHAGQAFRMAANGLSNSKSPLGDFYRRIRAKAGAGKAVVATARKLAIIFYKMVANQEAFNPKAIEDYQEKYKQKKINQLKRKLELLEAA